MVPGLAAQLPDALVRLAPRAGRRVGDAAEEGPLGVVELTDLLAEDVDGVEQLAVDVQLSLAPGAVPDADRDVALSTTKLRELPLGEVVLTPDPVHDLQRAAGVQVAGRCLQLHLPLEAGRRAQQHVRRTSPELVATVPLPERQGVALAQEPARGGGRRLEDERVGEEAAGDLCRSGDAEAPVTGPFVEQSTEHR